MIYTKKYPAPIVNERECLRYAGTAPQTISEGEKALFSECLTEALAGLSYQVCWGRFPIRRTETTLEIGFFQTDSLALRKNLEGCEEAILFAATIGIGIDRLIRRYSLLSPAKALFFQAIGAERIESLCDAFCAERKEEGLKLRPRFSPGYGDLPLELQRELFRGLDCARKIGLTLNESLLMSPSKSVTAIAGIGGAEAEKNI
ncbi:MAG: vitamin B12 dependent-methionine synthase activation domain-containing protein [Bacillota bacterium]|nr:vitamin B12 dependent-methionine synthase activation domain-containing protein [Bacillota bacterium]